MNAERVLIVTRNSRFESLVLEVCAQQRTWAVKGDCQVEMNCEIIESSFSGKGPTIVLFDLTCHEEDRDQLNRLDELKLTEFNQYIGDGIGLPCNFTMLRQLDTLRRRNSWVRCLLVVFTSTYSVRIIQALQIIGADYIFKPEFPPAAKILDTLLSLRTIIEPKKKRKLKVLVAENHVDTFLLLQALLMDFCNLHLAVDHSNENLRSMARLSPATVVNKFRHDSYDAVIVDLALSPEQEKYGDSHYATFSGMQRASVSVTSAFEQNLHGLIVLQLLRKESRAIPICVFSNYVGQPKFRKLMRSWLGLDVFETIGVFTKDPDGRHGMCEWLNRLSGSEDCLGLCKDLWQ